MEDNKMKLKITESFDKSLKKIRRTYSLNHSLCYLSVFFDEQRELVSISFDVEAADDYHYGIDASQLPQLCKFLQCSNNEADIVAAINEQLKSWKDPIEIADLCRNAEIKYHVHHWY